MLQQSRSQSGAYLIIASILMVVLVGIGALALDLGRLFVLRSEMQNAADAAALAAALELRRDADAQARATNAARDVLEHDSKFASVTDLLGVNISLEFFCAIGSEFDPLTPSTHCSETMITEADGKTKWPAAGPEDSHYVRVNLNQDVTSDAYSIPLFFLPVLSLFGENIDAESFLVADALAGRNFYSCDFPPVMLCNPFEDDTPPQDFQDAMPVGGHIILADQGPSTSWAPGNFAFLSLNGATGADANADYLADEGTVGCSAPLLTTEPGQMTQRTENAIDTRFDQYFNPGYGYPNAPNDYPPAPNVIDYPPDTTYIGVAPPDNRFGTGVWNRNGYWTNYHAWQAHPAPSAPGPLDGMTRYEVYQWEISTGNMPVRNPAPPGCSGLQPTGCNGNPTHTPGPPERRVMTVAVINCIAKGITGRRTFAVFGQEGFAKFFLSQQAEGPPARRIHAEYIGWASAESDSNLHVDVQLYE